MKRLFAAILLIVYTSFTTQACIGFCEHSSAEDAVITSLFNETCKYKSHTNKSYIAGAVKSTVVFKLVKLPENYCDKHVSLLSSKNFFQNSLLSRQVFQDHNLLLVKSSVLRL